MSLTTPNRGGLVWSLPVLKSGGLNERKFFPKKELVISHAQDIEAQFVKFGKKPEVPKEKIVTAERYEKLAQKVGTYGLSLEEAVDQLMRYKGNEIVRGAKPFIRDLVEQWKAFKNSKTGLSLKRTKSN